MNKLCFGGSFNPIHYGHLICAQAANDALKTDGVIFLPANRNPHKTFAELAANNRRLDMLKLATANYPDFLVDDRELKRPPPSYTFDTVLEFSREFGTRPKWLIGTDNLPKLHTWYRFDELIQIVDFIVMHRAGESFDPSKLDPRVQSICKQIIDVPPVKFSSSEIRERVRNNQPIDTMTPPAVVDYIRNHQLYR